MKRSLNHYRGVIVLWYGLQGGIGPPKKKKTVKKRRKTHPECTKIGEIASEGRRRKMDHEQPVKVI
jgi:hypothetical protein